MLSQESIQEVRAHIEKYPDTSVEVITTLLPGYVSCIGPVPTIFDSLIHCREEDYAEVRRLLGPPTNPGE